MSDTWDAFDGPQEAAPAVRHEHAVPHDRFDARSRQEALIESSGLRSQQNWATKGFDYAKPFLEDLFFTLLQGDPLVRDRGEMDLRYIPNREMVARFVDSPEWQELRTESAHHVITSAIAMLSMNDAIRAALEAMQRARDLAQEAQEQAEALKQALQQQQDSEPGDGESADDAPGDGAPGDSEPGGGQQPGDGPPADAESGQPGGSQGEGDGPSLQELMDAAEKSRQIAQAAAEQAASSMAGRMRAAAKQAGDEIAQEAQLAAAFGLEDGQLKQMSMPERVALMERLRHNRLVKFLDLIGAMKAMAEAQWRRQVSGVPAQIAGIEMSNELGRLVPAELVSLVVPALKADFMRRFAEHGLMTWEVSDNERLGKGPIVVVCDESGSMAAPDVGGVTREAWSKAVCLAIADTAKRQRRAMYYVGFSSATQQFQVPERDVAWDLDASLAMAEHNFNGGTHYERPLGMALGMARHWFDTAQRTRADIVFISDDNSGTIGREFLADWVETREKLSIGCHGILIGYPASEAMAALCDTVRPLQGIVKGAEVDAATDLITELLK